MNYLAPNAGPFFLPASGHLSQPRGVLLLHGFTATPHQLREMGEYLAARGISVLAPRLAGHASSPRDLARTTWRDWYLSALDGYEMLRPQVESLWVVGLSLGSLLALYLAAQRPVAGVAALSTPLVLRDQRIARLARGLPLRYLRKRPAKPDRDPNLATYISYPVYPLRGIAEMLRLQKEVSAILPRLATPVLLVHSPSDTLAPIENVTVLQHGLAAARVETVVLPECDHVVTMDYVRADVFEQVMGWIDRDGRKTGTPANE